MSDAAERRLRDQLAKIEALFAGAGTPGEKAAAGAAAERIRARLRQVERTEKPIELRFSIPDPWSRQLFMALCRRYGLTPYRYRRMQRQSVLVTAPESFLRGVLWPEFTELNRALSSYLSEVTKRVIAESVHRDSADAEERDEPARLA